MSNGEKTTTPQALEPVKVAIIGTPSVTGGPTPLTTGTVATTPSSSQPNIVTIVVSPLVALVIRFINVYVGMVVGLLGTAMTSDAIPFTDFADLLVKCAGLAIGGAVVLSLKDIVTIFGKLEQKFPLITGQV